MLSTFICSRKDSMCFYCTFAILSPAYMSVQSVRQLFFLINNNYSTGTFHFSVIKIKYVDDSKNFYYS